MVPVDTIRDDSITNEIGFINCILCNTLQNLVSLKVRI